MNIPIEIIGVGLAALFTVLIGVQSWVLLELVNLKISVGKLKQQIDDHP